MSTPREEFKESEIDTSDETNILYGIKSGIICKIPTEGKASYLGIGPARNCAISKNPNEFCKKEVFWFKRKNQSYFFFCECPGNKTLGQLKIKILNSDERGDNLETATITLTGDELPEFKKDITNSGIGLQISKFLLGDQNTKFLLRANNLSRHIKIGFLSPWKEHFSLQ